VRNTKVREAGAPWWWSRLSPAARRQPTLQIFLTGIAAHGEHMLAQTFPEGLQP